MCAVGVLFTSRAEGKAGARCCHGQRGAAVDGTASGGQPWLKVLRHDVFEQQQVVVMGGVRNLVAVYVVGIRVLHDGTRRIGGEESWCLW